MEDLFGVCPFITAQKLLASKWAVLIFHHLDKKVMRFNELQRALPEMTHSTLSKQLRNMERHGLIKRKVYRQVPPKVEYSLSDIGRKFRPVLAAIEAWGNDYIHFMKGEDARLGQDPRG